MIGSFRRRGVLAGLMAFAAGPLPALAQGSGFSALDVQAMARARAQKPWSPPTRTSAAAAGITYDEYRQIRHRRDRWLWAEQKLPFASNFFAASYSANEIVSLNEVVDGQSRPFDPALFEMPDRLVAATAAGQGLAGYSGFRLFYPLNDPAVLDEIGAFQGASYFRSLGRGQAYGLSARGLSIGTGEQGEEFPDFVAWWLERPKPGATVVVVHALLDSMSCTGAYRFGITPGANTVFDITAKVYPRQSIEKAGSRQPAACSCSTIPIRRM
jgi:glucans biosynthesis protein